MTIQQEAYQMIDTLADSSVAIVVEFMRKLPQKKDFPSPSMDPKATRSRKMLAYERLQELRKEMAMYNFGDFETEREAAMREKYGDF